MRRSRPARTASLLPLAAVALAIPLVACLGGRTTVTTTVVPPPVQRSWVGVRVEQVVSIWGEPAEKSPDGEGGTILLYRSQPNVKPTVTTGSSSNPAPPGSPVAGPGGITEVAGTTGTDTRPEPTARFWISSAGKVYRFWFSEKVYKSGNVPTPPPPAEG